MDLKFETSLIAQVKVINNLLNIISELNDEGM